MQYTGTVRLSDIPEQFLQYTEVEKTEHVDMTTQQNKKRTASNSDAALFVLLVLLFLYNE